MRGLCSFLALLGIAIPASACNHVSAVMGVGGVCPACAAQAVYAAPVVSAQAYQAVAPVDTYATAVVEDVMPQYAMPAYGAGVQVVNRVVTPQVVAVQPVVAGGYSSMFGSGIGYGGYGAGVGVAAPVYGVGFGGGRSVFRQRTVIRGGGGYGVAAPVAVAPVANVGVVGAPVFVGGGGRRGRSVFRQRTVIKNR